MLDMPSDHVFYRSVGGDIPVAVGGDGAYLVAADGRRYLDASGGAAVSCLGHSDPEVIGAMHDQLDRLSYAHTAFFTTDVAETLADTLAAAAPGDLKRAYFLSGGSEAMDTALKMARQYFVECGQPDRELFIARRQSYHGNTLGALSASGHPSRREPFRRLLSGAFRHVSPCYPYRYRQDGETDEDMSQRLADELEAQVLELGPRKVVGFLAETVVGATAGAVTATPGYFRKIQEICDRHGMLLILDEVMCGMGRTGSLFACEQEDVVPDMVTIAKGLAAGYQPIGAVIVTEKIHGAFRQGSGAFRNGHTYMGHPIACAAALAVQRRLQYPGMMQQVSRLGAYLHDCLRDRLRDHRHVGDIRGRGLFRAIELVADRTSKAPFDPETGLHGRIKAEAMRRDLLCYPNGGTADGIRGDHVLLAPPYIVTEAQIDDIVGRLGEAVDAALGGLSIQ